MYPDIAVIIPARLSSSRLHQKALTIIGDKPMIQHTYEQVSKAGFTHTYVATDSLLIAEVIEKIGGKIVMTSKNHTTGTDRVYEALQKLAIPNIDYVINFQGDMPFAASHILNDLAINMKKHKADITTLAAKVDMAYAQNTSNVKIVTDNFGKALYFSRQLIPHGAGEFLYHIGIYGYTVGALQKFISLPVADLENFEKLEQLRALANGMNIQVFYTDTIPISVDTPSDLSNAITYYENNLKHI